MSNNLQFSLKDLQSYPRYRSSNTLMHDIAYACGKGQSLGDDFWRYVEAYPETLELVTNKGFTPIVSFFAGLCGTGHDDHDVTEVNAVYYLQRYFDEWKKIEVNKFFGATAFIEKFIINAQKAWIILPFNKIATLFMSQNEQ